MPNVYDEVIDLDTQPLVAADLSDVEARVVAAAYMHSTVTPYGVAAMERMYLDAIQNLSGAVMRRVTRKDFVVAPPAPPAPPAVVERPALVDGVVYQREDSQRYTMTDLSGVHQRPDFQFQRDYDFSNQGVVVYRYGTNGTNSSFSWDCLYPRDIVMRGEHVMNERRMRGAHAHLYAMNSIDDWGHIYEAISEFLNGSPWGKLDAIRKNLAIWAEHLPIRSSKMPGMVAYFQSPDKRARGVRTPIKPGKYLQKFFSHVLSAEEIHDLGVAWTAWAQPPKLTITQDADEIEKVYRSTYNGSCMHFEHGGWSGDCHPARIYAGPDLALAYLGNADEDNGVQARVLCWPEKKLFIDKMYGNDRLLKEALIADGWRCVERQEFCGVRVRYIPASRYGSRITAPYVDFGGWIAKNDDEAFCRIVDEEDAEDYDLHWHCSNTNGTSDDAGPSGRVTCEITGRRFDPEDGGAYIDGEGWVSPGALNDLFSWSDYEDAYIRDDDVVRVNRIGVVSDDTVSNDPDIFQCELSDEYYHVDYQEKVELGDGRGYAARCNIDAYDYEVCDYDDCAYPAGEMIDVTDNGTMLRVHKSYADHYVIEETTDIAA